MKNFIGILGLIFIAMALFTWQMGLAGHWWGVSEYPSCLISGVLWLMPGGFLILCAGDL